MYIYINIHISAPLELLRARWSGCTDLEFRPNTDQKGHQPYNLSNTDNKYSDVTFLSSLL